MKWTDSQQDAIDVRDSAVLVAAAAGSGKTAVLVQRAIERLTDPEKHIPADRLLIVTFTRAAAAEMRSRLEKALQELIHADPENTLLRRQVLLLGQAHIGTIHSFCGEMVREYFHVLGVSPDYKILSDKQQEDLLNEALNEALEHAYQTGDAFLLADHFAGERNDDRLIETVCSIYKFMQSHPFPERWLREKTAMYHTDDPAVWQNVILEYAAESLRHCLSLCRRGLEECEYGDEDVASAFSATFADDYERLSQLLDTVQRGDWDAASAQLGTFQFGRRKGRIRKENQDFFFRRLDNLRDSVKKDMLPKLKKCVYGTTAQCCDEMSSVQKPVDLMCELVLDVQARYAQKKRERNMMDYSDLEHFTIELFYTPQGERTEAALAVSERFDEIMIDEYQDVNEVQDSVFRAISRDGSNLFMVGDVKQSIYGFRSAMPEIFLRCRRLYTPYSREEKPKPGTPVSITLDANFRSREEVTRTVNFVFSNLMSESAGDVDYTGNERLTYGADYTPGDGNETELVFLNREIGVPANEAESRWIARRIQQMMQEGYRIEKKINGEKQFVPVQYSDFCILLRSPNKQAHLYVQELAKYGVPAKASISGDFFSAAEVGVMLSLLQVIDNPNQDIPLLAVLMSPICGFSAEDCARLRAEDRTVSVYVSLIRAAEQDPRCAAVLDELDELRSLAAAMPSDRFLALLYERTGYPDLVLSMESGAERLENLRQLQSYAKEYEGNGYHGISGFVRFLDRLRRNNGDLQGAELAPGSQNAVSIMSIHKSKGLQFPVVIVADCGHQFNNDNRNDVLLHQELGLGVKLRDAAHSARYTTTACEAIKLEKKRASVSEELRVLYVAMTRAEDKLILLSSGKKMDEQLTKMALQIGEDGISPYTVRTVNKMSQWLMLCALRHPDGRLLRDLAGAEGIPIAYGEEDTPWRVSLIDDEPLVMDALIHEPTPAELTPPDVELLARLRRAAEYRYPHEKTMQITAKVAVSRLAAEQGSKREMPLSRPAWMGEKGMTPAQRGTALHQFVQFMDYSAAAEDIEAELHRLVDRGYISEEEAAAVDLARVLNFLHSELGQRIRAAERVYREKRFAVTNQASLAAPDTPSAEGESIILQGAIDCAFVENGRLHIVDFKTDRIRDTETLVERYAAQLKLYSTAMHEVTGMEIGELLLYSFHLSKTIEIPS